MSSVNKSESQNVARKGPTYTSTRLALTYLHNALYVKSDLQIHYHTDLLFFLKQLHLQRVYVSRFNSPVTFAILQPNLCSQLWFSFLVPKKALAQKISNFHTNKNLISARTSTGRLQRQINCSL